MTTRCLLHGPVLRSHISEYSASAALFQCQHSTDQDGQVFIPNIPDYYFDHSNAARENSLLTQTRPSNYFFTIPPESAERNCSGTVVAIQYCHRASQHCINSTQDVFSFHSVTRDDLVFTVTSSFTVRTTPLESKCTQVSSNGQNTIYLCCDTSTLSAGNQLSILPGSYTFGVTIVERRVAPYAFKDTEFVVDQFQGSLDTTIQVGTSFNFTESEKVNAGLLLMRLIGNNNIIHPSSLAIAAIACSISSMYMVSQ